MASSGWQNEQEIYRFSQWGWFNGNVYIGGITRYIDRVYVTGSVRLACRGSNMWYNNRIAICVDGGTQGREIKGWTAGVILTGSNYDVGFDTTLYCSAQATSATVTVHYDDQQAGAGWMHSTASWGISFDKAEQPPYVNPNNIAISNPGVWKLTSSVSGVDWGVGSTYKTLTATVSYTFQGVNYSYEAGRWTDGRTSASISINSYNDAEPWKKVPAGVSATVTWKAQTNISSSSASKSVTCKAPNAPTIGSITTSNPDVYCLSTTVSNINWGDYYKSRDLQCVFSGTIDGNNVYYASPHYTDGATSKTVSVNAKSLTNPWLKVPDDENETVTWTAKIDVGYTTLTAVISKTQYCQPSYEVFIIDPSVNGGAPVAAEMKVSASAGGKPNTEVRRFASIE